jgi:hypothetical protein
MARLMPTFMIDCIDYPSLEWIGRSYGMATEKRFRGENAF